MHPGWRRLALFWAAILALSAGGAAALQVLGPLDVPPPARASQSVPPVAPHPVPQAATALPGAAPGIIRAPDAALLEPAPDFPGQSLPRRAPDGRASLAIYARPADPADKRPAVALLLAGLGLSEAESRAALALPGAISLGMSPYSPAPDPLLQAARAQGHEFFVTLPMESQGYPLNDSGRHALLTGADPADNSRNLEWVLSRMQGEVGLTGASDGLRGENFARAGALFGPVLDQLGTRGLLYVDPRPGTPPQPGRPAVAVVVDEPPDAASIDAKLAQLEQRARDGQPALGLVVAPRPVTVERIGIWAQGLDARGIALVPVSALAAAR